MAFKKIATFSYKKEIKALNTPTGWDIFNLPKQIKTASANVIEAEDLGGFDLKTATKEHPDNLYIKVFAIKKDEPNDNADAFSEEELIKAADSFVGVPLFTNHQNDDVEKSRGECVHSWYDKKEGGIYIIGRVDKVAYPKLARGIEEGYITGTSMGAINGNALITMHDLSRKPISEVIVGEKVLTPFGNIETVEEIHCDLLLDDMYSFDIGNFAESPYFTKDHPILSLKNNEVDKSKKGWRENQYTPVFRDAQDINVGDYFLIPSKFKLVEKTQEDLDFYYLLGAFLGDGYVKISRGKIEGFSFCFGLKEKQDLAQKIKNIISNYSDYEVVEKIKEERNGLYLDCYDRDLAQKILDFCGTGSHNKRIKIRDFTKNQIKSLISGYIDTDGCMAKDYSTCNNVVRGFNICSCNKKLLEDIQSLLILLDCITGIKSINRKSRENSIVNIDNIEHNLFIGLLSSNLFKESFKVSCNLQDKISTYTSSPNLIIKFRENKYIACRVKKINLLDDYNKEVYDLTISQDKSYIANNIAIHNCSVEYSICSICHNKAHTADEYCDHIKNRKNRVITSDVKCAYHESPVDDLDDKCPICKSEKTASKNLSHNSQKVFEHNFGLKFIENSFVVNPACHDCGVRCVLHIPEIQKKVASFKNAVNALIKNASDPDFVEENIDNLVKIGGVEELNLLKTSMDQLEKIVQSMLKQKENVSMDYVSDIVKSMAELQATYDELNEMGYAKLPSAVTIGEDSSPLKETSQIVDNSAMGTGDIQNNVPPIPSSFSGVETGDLNGLGNITKPKISSKKIEDFNNINERLINKISKLIEIVELENNNNNSKNIIGANMAIENKTAAGKENQEIITEKQLEKKTKSLHPRTEEVVEGITESKEQIGGAEKSNDTSSDSPQVRQGGYDVITEGQLNASSSEIVRFDDVPEVITEKQWTDMSNEISSKVSDDYTSQITEAQIRDLLSSHKFVGAYETITEDQLKNITMNNDSKRWANQNYALTTMKIAMDAMSDAIAKFNKSPEEIAKIASHIVDDLAIKSKVAFLTVVNSLPCKKEQRELLANKVSYFSKVASKNSQISDLDALIISVASNSQFGIKAEDVFDSISYATKNKTVLAKVDKLAIQKMAKNTSSKTIISKSDAMDSAIKAMDRPVDGKYIIKATLQDIPVPISNKVAFVKGVKKFAQEMIDDEGVAAAVIKIEVGGNGELIINVQDGAEDGSEVGPDDIEEIMEGPVEEIEVCNIKEDEDMDENINEDEDMDGKLNGGEPKEEEECDECEDTFASRKEIMKKAQMMGGEMGGQAGVAQGPGAGATMPQMPGVEAAPMQNLTEEAPLEEDMESEGEADPLPPGSICPVCGSKDVDIVSGRGKCNNCGSEMNYKVEINVTKWKDLSPEGEEEAVDDEFGEGEGFEMPEAGMETEDGMEAEMPSVAAMVKLNPASLKKLASDGVQVGTISPATGLNNTVDLGQGNHICLDSGTKYKVAYATDTKAKTIWAQWEWMPRVNNVNVKCASCSRAKLKFVKALSSIGITESQFDVLDIENKVKAIKKVKASGALKGTLKTASKEGSVIGDYKVAFGGYGDSFPCESCREKLARRFGENALALSGPCEGQNLADCVCDQLKKADIYTDRISIKVAENWSDCSGDEDCITDQVRTGYSLREAASLCETLKIAVAEPEDLLADELTDSFDDENSMDDVDNVEEDSFPVEGDIDNVDPFENEDNGENVSITIDLPKDIAEDIAAQIDGETNEEVSMEEGIDTPEEEMAEESAMGEPSMGEEEIIEEVSPEDIEGGNFDDTKPCEDVIGETNFEADLENPENNKGVLNNNIETNKNNKVQVNVDPSLASVEYDFKEASNMKSKQGGVGKVNMNLSNIIDVLNKQASEKEIKQENAQDSKDIGQYSAGEGGSKIGHENDTIPSESTPSVPRDNATMGQEDSDLNPQDKPQPKIPSENATMGHEDEVGLSGGDNRYTGGDQGSGKTSTASTEQDLMHMRGYGSSKDGLTSLAERILQAGEKKLETPAPVADDKDIQPIKGDGTIGKEEKFDAKAPENVKGEGNSSMIGSEKETLGDKPDSPKDHPSVSTGNAQMGREELDSEKTTKDKGTVIAKTESDNESEAYRVAARMLEAKMIVASDLQQKIKELKTYKPAQIKDIEKSIFASKKGLDSVSDGMSQAVIIDETSSERLAQAKGGDELRVKLASMFSLEKQNQEADDDADIQLRRTFKK